jgi:hypothetical protein
MNINLFNIDTVGRSENIIILKGSRYNNTRFTIYISRSINNDNIHINQLENYIYAHGTYYIITIDNFNQENSLINYENFIWEHTKPDINEFPFYIYGIHHSAYSYIKGLIL